MFSGLGRLQRAVASSSAAASSSTRFLSQSAAAHRALAFSLNGTGAAHDDRDERTVRMIMFGKPGAGKGTLTSRLRNKYDITTISTGDLLRQHIAARTEIGVQAEAIVARGELLPDEIVLKVVASKLETLSGKVRSIPLGPHRA